MKLLIISADLKPRFVVNQIILLALGANQETRILCVPNMDKLMQPILNFPCFAFVISNESWSRFSALDEWTAELVEKHFPVSDVNEAYFGQQKDDKTTCSMEIDEPETKSAKKFGSVEEKIDLNSIYLTRDKSEPNQRVFVPKNAINMKPIALELESLNKIKSDYISLDAYGSSAGPSSSQNPNNTKESEKKLKRKRKTPLVLYRALTVHKVQSNPNKVKKNKNKKKNKKIK